MRDLTEAIDQKVRRGARRSAWALTGAVGALAGSGFIVHGLWLWAALHNGPLLASLMVGFGLLLAGGICIWLAGRPRHARPDVRHGPRSELPLFQIAEGFAAGIGAGRAARNGG